MKRQVAINGFGRIGRAFTRIAESKKIRIMLTTTTNNLHFSVTSRQHIVVSCFSR